MDITPELMQQIEALAGLASGFLPTKDQPYAKLAIIDLPLLYSEYEEVAAAIAKLPPKETRTFVLIIEAFGVTAGPLHSAASLVDLGIAQRAALVAAPPAA